VTRPTIAVFSLGGTIAMTPGQVRTAGYTGPERRLGERRRGERRDGERRDGERRQGERRRDDQTHADWFVGEPTPDAEPPEGEGYHGPDVPGQVDRRSGASGMAPGLGRFAGDQRQGDRRTSDRRSGDRREGGDRRADHGFVPHQGGPPEGHTLGGVEPTLTGHDLVAALPDLATVGIDVEVHDVMRAAGGSLRFADVAALMDRIEDRLRDGVDGVVVTQGTDTIEETAYLLDLWHPGDAPLVVTGAMRAPSALGADGAANLISAIRVAASRHAPGLGCLVVMADEVHAARLVSKTHSLSTGAFTSPGAGPVGHLAEGCLRLLGGPADRVTVARSRALPGDGEVASADPVPVAGPEPRVGLVTLTLGDDGSLLEALEDKVDALVVAGFGVGHAPAELAPVLGRLAARMPVVLTSRTGAGPVLRKTYGYPGSELDLLDRGLVRGGYLPPLKARVLLYALLTRRAGRAEIAETVHRAGGVPAG
jgi:L-asparaginase